MALLKILGCNNIDSYFSALLELDGTRYLINSGDGMQRLASENGSKLTNVDHIFLNDDVSASTIGGIIGFGLTKATNLATRVSFTIHGDISDEIGKQIKLQLQYMADVSIDDSSFFDHDVKISRIIIDNLFVGLHIVLPTKKSKLDLEFVEHNKLSKADLKEIFIKKEAVIHGKVYKASDLTLPPIETGEICILNEKICKLSPDGIIKLSCFVTDSTLVILPEHTNLIKLLEANNINYFYTNPLSPSATNRAQLLIRKALLSDGMPPLIFPTKTKPRELVTGDAFQIKNKILTYSKLNGCIENTEIEEYFRKRDFIMPTLIDSVPEYSFNPDKTYLIPLGTGSAIPNKYRNVSSTMILFFDKVWCSFFVDFGEATLLTLKRTFRNADEIIANCKGVYITHNHADHFLGMLGLLEMNRNIPIGVPETVKNYLFAFFSTNLITFDRDHYQTSQLLINSVDAIHGMTEAKSVVIIVNGIKFAFSGDTRPNKDFADLAMGASVMMHEATFSDELIENAVTNCHSTLGEALEIARRAHARTIVLSHFSQRYPRVPPVSIQEFDIIYASDQMIIDLSDIKKSVDLSAKFFAYFTN